MLICLDDDEAKVRSISTVNADEVKASFWKERIGVTDHQSRLYDVKGLYSMRKVYQPCLRACPHESASQSACVVILKAKIRG